jgi:hypothetical protein
MAQDVEYGQLAWDTLPSPLCLLNVQGKIWGKGVNFKMQGWQNERPSSEEPVFDLVKSKLPHGSKSLSLNIE